MDQDKGKLYKWVVTSVHLAPLPEPAPVMPQSTVPRSKAVYTSPKAMDTGWPPRPLIKSPAEGPLVRTFKPLRSANDAMALRQNSICPEKG